MDGSASIKKTHAAVKKYYSTLEKFSDHQVMFEGAVSTAFQSLLSDTSKNLKWTLIPQFRMKAAGQTIIPDGALKDDFGFERGYWEAKDTDDKLDFEIRKKIEKGYPTKNTIFEDTRTAVLYQNGHEYRRYDITKPIQLSELLNDFYSFVEPPIQQFEKALAEFKIKVPELAEGLTKIIAQAHTDNYPFIKAFDGFFTLCQSSLNPNISQAAVDEMLVQHLLTERLIRKIFDNPEFTRRNVIAAEVEKVIEALTSKSFNREDFMRRLDRFYFAIEDAAHGLSDFSDKQHLLNMVYERFFQGYSVKLADTHGIVYTPQPIVDFMCASVAEVLEKEFGKSLGSPDVYIIDPCVGTGNFIVNLMRRMNKRDLPRVYEKQLFANEVMLMPYYIAALNIEHAYYEITGEYKSFEGLCFVDTLDMVEHAQTQLGFMTVKNAERVERQKKAPITVVIGNPPYNMGQVNENDNNKNREYKVVDGRIKDTYSRDSKATLKNKLFDPYVKFFRWATDRLNGRDGIVAFVSNNSFIDQIAFDGMRKHLGKDFTSIYHVDLHGNVRKNPKLSGTTHNVFGIQVGVGITIAIRKNEKNNNEIQYFRLPEDWRKEEKLNWLGDKESVQGVLWDTIEPDSRFDWLQSEHTSDFRSMVQIARPRQVTDELDRIFDLYSLGVVTSRDEVVYNFNRNELIDNIQEYMEKYNSEVDRYKRASAKSDPNKFVNYDLIIWTDLLKNALARGEYLQFENDLVRNSLYRPFVKEYLYFHHILNQRRYQMHHVFPNSTSEIENRIISVSGVGAEKPFLAFISNYIPNYAFVGFGTALICFPFYTYKEDGTGKTENITEWALHKFQSNYLGQRITKWDIFHYIYGILHHPAYRAKYGDCLKRDLPRIPFAPDFKAFRDAGKELSKWHLEYESVEPYPLKFIENNDKPLSYRVEDKMRLSKDKTQLTVNPSLTLDGIPSEAFEYRLGNRSALEWVIDQYQVKTGKRSGIKSDPNNPDDPEYIVNLVGRVIRVSLETVKIVNNLPQDFGG